jgi:hypothetical protein
MKLAILGFLLASAASAQFANCTVSPTTQVNPSNGVTT